MPLKKKTTTFEDCKLLKISGGDLLQEKPLLCNGGKDLVVNNKETCHLYNTTTGQHVKELFSCDAPIICLQPQSIHHNKLSAVTETGTIHKYCLDTGNELILKLELDSAILKELGVPLFNINTKSCTWEDNTPDVDWEEALKMGIKFHHVFIGKDTTYATWSLTNEFFAHCSAFDQKHKLKNVCPIPVKVGLARAPRNIDVGSKILLGMSTDFVYVKDLCSQSVQRKHLIGKTVELTCIALSRDGTFFATGDSDGRVLVWKNFFEKTPIKEVFHWHSLPVRTLALSGQGTLMFTGGDENVLVKWALTSREKTFLPRLTAALLNITLAEGSDTLAVSTADCRILIISTSLNCIATIQHFSRWCAIGKSYEGGILAHEPKTDALVLSGRTGHVQFISTADHGSFLYTFDVTNRNFITNNEKNSVLENVEVRLAKFSRCGKWLVTAESGAGEAVLKFWLYDDKIQEYKLNTAVDAPHGLGGFRSLEVSSDEQAVTTGPDNKFRLWNLVEATHLQQVRIFWTQVSSNGYRDLPVTVGDFARDGSLVGVGFGPALAVWDTDSLSLKCSLTPPLRRNHVKAVRFGNQEVAHLVVTGTDAEVTCWNLVTLCMNWMVPLNLSTIVSDPNSLYMCAFSRKGGLFIFNPSSAFPEVRLENICKSEVSAGVFVTKTDMPYVYFLTSDQELYCFGEDTRVVLAGNEPSKLTAFARQIPERSGKGVQKQIGLTHVYDPASKFPVTILDGPAYSLPPVSLLLEDVLKSLLLTVSVPDASAKNIQAQEIANKAPTSFSSVVPPVEEPQLLEIVDKLFADDE